MVSSILFHLLWLASSIAVSTAASFRLYGVNYAIRDGPDWTTVETGRCKDYNRVVSELQSIKDEITHRVRIYTMNDCDTANIVLQAAQQVGGMEVWLGLWVSEDPAIFELERMRFLQLLDTVSMDNVIGVHVSSESIYREEITANQAIQMRNIIKDDLVAAGISDIPVTVADVIGINLQNARLIFVDDNVVTFNQFPFWEQTTNINFAADHMRQSVEWMEMLAGHRQIIITETGWADAGIDEYANPANPAAMRKWLRDFYCLAEERGWQYFWFNAFDNDWRRINEQSPDDVEGHFGLFDEQGRLKPYIANLQIDCSRPSTFINPNGGAPPTEQPLDWTLPSPVPTMAPNAIPFNAPISSTSDSINNGAFFVITNPPVSEANGVSPHETPSFSKSLSSGGAAPSTQIPTTAPTGRDTSFQTRQPTNSPTGQPMRTPTGQPTTIPTGRPTTAPVTSAQVDETSPSERPSAAPTGQRQPTATPFAPSTPSITAITSVSIPSTSSQSTTSNLTETIDTPPTTTYESPITTVASQITSGSLALDKIILSLCLPLLMLNMI